MLIEGKQCPACHGEIRDYEWEDLDNFQRYFCDICGEEITDTDTMEVVTIGDDPQEICCNCCKKPLTELIRLYAANEENGGLTLEEEQVLKRDPVPPSATTYLAKLTNEATVYLVLAMTENGAMLRINTELGLKPGTLTEEDMEIFNLDNMKANMQDERHLILKVAEL